MRVVKNIALKTCAVKYLRKICCLRLFLVHCKRRTWRPQSLVYLGRGGAFMFLVLARLTLRKTKNSLLFSFRGSVVLHTLEHSRTDQIKRIVSQLQPTRRSRQM
jgi:hypothetical protein